MRSPAVVSRDCVFSQAPGDTPAAAAQRAESLRLVPYPLLVPRKRAAEHEVTRIRTPI